jgi:hypothetical protein
MIHRHHIKPRYEGGGDEPSNIVPLTPIQHSMWHFAEWQRKGRWQDFCAHKMILGDVNNPEFRRAAARVRGEAGAKRLLEKYPPGDEHWKQIGTKGNKGQREKLRAEGRTIAEQRWVVTSPEGEEFEICNMAKFCREHNLLKNKMCEVGKGMWKQHRGWKCRKG